ncbi:MAG: shikimate kinase, partial [Planctomycetota bacterium]
GWDWADCDVEVEKRCGASIRDIFEHEGEAGFRRRESEVLEDLLSSPQLVVASGGCAILARSNRQKMRAAGPVVWLQATIETLARRLNGEGHGNQHRPSLTGKPIHEEIAEVLRIREPLYREAATLIIDVENTRPDLVARRIQEALLPILPQERKV